MMVRLSGFSKFNKEGLALLSIIRLRGVSLSSKVVDWRGFMNGVANDFRNALVDRVPVDTGRLKGSIRVKTVNDSGFELSMADYGAFVEFGTAPHVIEPKDKKALHWKAKGTGPRGGSITTDVFAKKVHHPGTASNPFIRDTMRNKMKDIIISNIRRHTR